MRYTVGGAEEVTFAVPSSVEGRHTNDDTDTLSVPKKTRVWVAKESRANFNTHILEGLLNDKNFIREYAPKWVVKGLKKYTSNLYVSFFTTEDGYDDTCGTFLKVRKPRVGREDVNTETPAENNLSSPMSFREFRDTLNSKIRLTKTLNHFTDPYPINNFYGNNGEKERVLGVVKNVFNSYKLHFEELLTSRNISFYISKENYALPVNTRRRHGVDMYVEYVLVDNTEDAPFKIMDRQSWSKITLAWFASQRMKKSDNYYGRREYETIINTKKVGIAANSASNINRGDIHPFAIMRDSIFTNIVEKVQADNNRRYVEKIEAFKTLKMRASMNKVEVDKLKDFVVKNIISMVPAKFLKNSALELDKGSFEIEATCGYNRIDILDISTQYDDFDRLKIRMSFFGARAKEVETADKAIEMLQNVYSVNDFRGMLNIYDNVSSMS